MALTLLMLFIVNLGLVFGAGIYETRIVVPMWFSKSTLGYHVHATLMRDMDVGRKFWGFATTVPLTLLTLASIFVTWNAETAAYTWWLAAALITLVERIATFGFFIPNAIKLQKSETQSPALSRLAGIWINVNYLRIILNLMAWLAALKALALGI